MKLQSCIVVLCLVAFTISLTFVTSCAEKKSAKGQSATTEESATAGPVASHDLPKAPMFQGKNLVDDTDISLEGMKGYVLIIDFWATWCGPCRIEIPGFIELYDKYKDKKFAVIGISLDRGGESVVRRFIAEYKMSYPVIMATRQIVSDYEKAMGKPIRGIPTTLVVNREGGIASVYVGVRPKHVFEQEIQKLL
jgi:thiol-disulfide isomerase/thioredoxin